MTSKTSMFEKIKNYFSDIKLVKAEIRLDERYSSQFPTESNQTESDLKD